MRVDYSIRVIRFIVSLAELQNYRHKLFGLFLVMQVFALHTYTMSTMLMIGKAHRYRSLVTTNLLISQNNSSGICFQETDRHVGCGLISVLLVTLMLILGWLILFNGGLIKILVIQ